MRTYGKEAFPSCDPGRFAGRENAEVVATPGRNHPFDLRLPKDEKRPRNYS